MTPKERMTAWRSLTEPKPSWEIFKIARDLNLESEEDLAFCKEIVNNAIRICKSGQGFGSDWWQKNVIE